MGIQSALRQSFINFEKTRDSTGREALCNILTEHCIPIKLVSPIKVFKLNL